MAAIDTAGRTALLTVPEVAHELRMSERKVWLMLQRGDLHRVTEGRSVRIRRDDMERWIDEHSEGQAS